MTKVIKLNIPVDDKKVRELNAGDLVELTGTIFLARDRVHKLLTEKTDEKFKEKLKNGVIYHCGPIARKEKEKWIILSAGPTTSTRMEAFEYDVIRDYGIKGVIGKGGMKEKTLKALEEFGAVYFLAVGGTAALLAERIVKVKNVFFLEEFGIPEALWEFEVKEFPLIVSMDSKGKSLHKEVLENSKEKLKKILGK
ncbi:MAG: FumA C-terminus/TtdB family hydratase beta subunit [Candidatus Micrarchaeota archaeon]